MWHIGVDLHRKTIVIAAVHDAGEVRPPVRCQNREVERIKETFHALRPFRAVVEATGTYRWFPQTCGADGHSPAGSSWEAAHHGAATLQD